MANYCFFPLKQPESEITDFQFYFTLWNKLRK